MTVTCTGASLSPWAVYNPAKPPPTMTTRGSVTENPSPPSSEPDYILDRGNGALLAVRSMQPPGQVLRIGQWQAGELAPPMPAAERPCERQQIQRHHRIDERTSRQAR